MDHRNSIRNQNNEDIKVKVTLSANSGVSLEFRSARIWIDAMHDVRMTGYSTLSEDQIALMAGTEAFSDPDAIIYTHCHDDHYSQRLAEQAMEAWPGARVFIPEDVLPGAEVISSSREVKWIGDVKVTFCRMTHMGDHYADVPHYGVLMQEGDFTLLFAGDTAVGSRELQAVCQEVDIDAALLPFPWITLRVGRRFVEDHIRPDHTILMHLPFDGEDTEGYRPAAQKSAAAWGGCPDVRIMDKFLQEEII